MQTIHRQRFDENIVLQFTKAKAIMKEYPQRLAFYLQALLNQQTASRARARQARLGLEVPPLLIISITNRCKLNCSGCYSKLLHRSEEAELNPEQFEKILYEAQELGISIVMLAGGEPLLRPEILAVAARFTKIFFPIFTNGLSITADYAEFFAVNPHLIPVLSLEGDAEETDERRGSGVYANFSQVTELLNASQVFWGISITINTSNYEKVLSRDFAQKLLGQGAKLFFYVEYVPVVEGNEDLVLSDSQKTALNPAVENLMHSLPGIFIAFPGDEDQYEGCLAAGRGFLHINPNGKVEPCPFAPYSDADLRFTSLRTALESSFLRKIRQNHPLLKEGKGGCALWANREWVQSIHES